MNLAKLISNQERQLEIDKATREQIIALLDQRMADRERELQQLRQLRNQLEPTVIRYEGRSQSDTLTWKSDLSIFKFSEEEKLPRQYFYNLIDGGATTLKDRLARHMFAEGDWLSRSDVHSMKVYPSRLEITISSGNFSDEDTFLTACNIVTGMVEEFLTTELPAEGFQKPVFDYSLGIGASS